VKHLREIEILVETLLSSEHFHALLIQGPPGISKSSSVENILKHLGAEFRAIGSFTTPLALFHSLAEAPAGLFLIDDVSGIFEDPTATAILRAATWPTAGTNGLRRITWSSQSEKVKQGSFEFSGKLILLTNSPPPRRYSDAVLSRMLYLNIILAKEDVADMLRVAAKSNEHYKDSSLAQSVAVWLISLLGEIDHTRVNLRTMRLGYELASKHPDSWQEILRGLLPRSARWLAKSLRYNGGNVEEQAREFSKQTGLSRRTFFNYRREQREAALDWASGEV
jgi:hypothetical protein